MIANTVPQRTGTTPMRDEAIDVVRAVAILGMFVIHAVLVLSADFPRSGGSAVVLWLCDGRAAATFVTLAGFGVSRLAAKYTNDMGRRILHRRALVLWAMGVLNLIIWPGDILRVYAVALFVAPWLLQQTRRARLWLAGLLVPAFMLGMVLLDWTQHWQLDTLTYVGVWTPSGFMRNLFFDGFRPVVPWLSFFLLGTVLAEVDLHDSRVPRRLLTAGIIATLVAVAASTALETLLMRVAPQLDALTREGLVGTTSLPPLPLFMLSAVGTTSLLLGSVLLLLPKLPRIITDTLVATGRRALTWYIWHIVILMTLYAFGYHHILSANASIVCGLLLFTVAVGWSRARASTPGLLESLMRRLSGATATSRPYVRESA